jgi:hypothetical protein
MAVPALDLLAAHGRALTLVGRPWARALFAYRWPVAVARLAARSRSDASMARGAFGAPGLLFTNSFSTALEFRLAGIAPTGYARGGRSWLLALRVPVDAGDHMVEYYHRLARAVVEANAEVPRDLSLRVSDEAKDRARALLASAGVRDRYVVLCPVASPHHGRLGRTGHLTGRSCSSAASGRRRPGSERRLRHRARPAR